MTHYQPKKLDAVKLETRPILEEITVVIPTLGRPILEESLYWIMAGTAWPGGLIVVDQGSGSQVASWIEELQLLRINAEYVPSDKRGRAAGVATAFYLLAPLSGRLSRRFRPDAPMMLMFLISLFGILKHYEQPSQLRLVVPVP